MNTESEIKRGDIITIHIDGRIFYYTAVEVETTSGFGYSVTLNSVSDSVEAMGL